MKQINNNNDRIKFATSIVLLVILSILAIFHALILLGIIPFDSIWGGKVKTPSQMYLFETVSFMINSVMILIIAIHSGFIKSGIQPMIIRGSLWSMFLLFMVNTAGNFNSENPFEKYVFTPVTLLLSSLCFILILTGKIKKINIL